MKKGQFINKVVQYFSTINMRWLLAWAAGILVLANVFVILIYFVGFGNQFEGSGSYSEIATNVVRQGIYSQRGETPTAYRPPAYPFFLAPMIAILGDQYEWMAILVQSLLDIGCGLLMFLLVLEIFNNRLAALISAFLFAIHFQFHLLSISKNEGILFAFLTLLFVFSLSNKRSLTTQIVMLPLAAGLAYLTRPTGILFFPIMIVFWLFCWQELKPKRAIIYMLISLAIALVVIAPWQIYVYHSFSTLSFWPTSTSGMNLYKGNNPDTDIYYPWIDPDLYSPRMTELAQENGVDTKNEVTWDHFMQSQAISYIMTHPVIFARRGLVKILALYSPLSTPIGRGDLKIENGQIELNNFELEPLWQMLPFTTVSALILTGILLFLKNLSQYKTAHKSQLLCILLLVAGFTLTHAITFAQTRFRLPFDPILIIFAGVGYSRYLALAYRRLIGQQDRQPAPTI